MDATEIRLPSPKELRAESGLRQRRRLGQRFLTSPTTLDRIVGAARLEPGMSVVEVGAGPGYLTARIRRCADRVFAIELDERFRPVHEECFGGLEPPVEFIYGDVLRLDWTEILGRIGDSPFIVMGNIPYQITSPLLELLLGLPRLPERIVLLVQREFAQRLAARPGVKAYGALTVKTALLADVRQAFFVPRHLFQPRPRVDSAAVLIEPRRPPMIDSKRLGDMFDLVNAAFVQRRKKIVNSLLGSGWLGDDRDSIAACLNAAGIDAARRPETLNPDEYVRLADAVAERRTSGLLPP